MEPFPQDKAAYTTRKKLFARVFFKKRKKVLREIREKFHALAQILLTRLRRLVIVILFRRIHPYLFYLQDVIQYH